VTRFLLGVAAIVAAFFLSAGIAVRCAAPPPATRCVPAGAGFALCPDGVAPTEGGFP
jgi:hypothetical protein